MNATDLPDEIIVQGTERHGHLHFSQDLELTSGKYIITLTIDGYQQMLYTNSEIYGVGWEVNEDGEININYIRELTVWDGESIIELTDKDYKKLVGLITNLINIEL